MPSVRSSSHLQQLDEPTRAGVNIDQAPAGGMVSGLGPGVGFRRREECTESGQRRCTPTLILIGGKLDVNILFSADP
jgi:hypothetical protein